jgi:uncharacterized protein (TIGR03437 family)
LCHKEISPMLFLDMFCKNLIKTAIFVTMVVVLRADVSGTVSLPSYGVLDLDTGATDSVFNGNVNYDAEWVGLGSISPGNLVLYDTSTAFSTGMAAFNALTEATLATYSYPTPAFFSSFALQPLGTLQPRIFTVGSVFALKTKCGNDAKVIVTSLPPLGGSQPVGLQFTTYTTNGSAGCPAITSVQNNYSYTHSGLPNYGIAPGSLFIVKGSTLSNQPLTALQSSAAPGLPTALNGTSISVTVGGTTTTPAIYYTSPTQIAAVLPSNTPAGGGTIKVTNAGITTATFPMQVVPTATGLDTLDGSGAGAVLAQDANYNLFSSTNSASPGQTIILWGSGVGADTSNDDKTYPMKQNNLTAIPMQVYIGGLAATVQYRGRSQFPGVDQIVVTIPQQVPVGCAVSVVAVSGNVVSNTVTLPIAAGGEACSDPLLTAGKLPWPSAPGIRYGQVDVEEFAIPYTNPSSALASFVKSSAASVVPGPVITPSIGSCVVQVLPAVQTLNTPNFLDAGTVSVSGPSGPPQTLTQYGDYNLDLAASFFPQNGGAFTFTGSGGKDVGPFTTTLNWTPLSGVVAPNGPVSRSQGQQVTWQGGDPGTYVGIQGYASLLGEDETILFDCTADASAGQFTIPPSILMAMPGGASVTVSNTSNPTSFTATGLDIGFGNVGTEFLFNVTYQ